ncbi:MAG: cardiolipin synthase [Planctomycetes bacterium]|nr:cardiolipin synthase [Planctomycetota bacterium]MBI3833764.1 cardiolipin synthase [Planctomycetota bacterium]
MTTAILSRTFVAAWIVLGMISAGHSIMFKRDPRSATIWLFMSFVFPIVGPWLYWAVGINRVQRRAVKRRGRYERITTLPDHAAIAPVSAADRGVIGHLESLRLMTDRITRMPMLSGNHFEPLHNGERAYPAMLEAIDQARTTITLESYIFDQDEIGRRFRDAITRAAERGVDVHVLLDGIGAVGNYSKMGRRFMKSGAKIAGFFPIGLPFGRVRLNLRNHRKILVVDGRVAFTGGMNISKRHLLRTRSPHRVEDLHFRVTGPVVGEIQEAFIEDWLLATGEALTGEKYFPRLEPTGKALARGVISGPDEDFEIVHWTLLAAFAAAQKSVRICTPYFVPSPALIAAMNTASLRGVQVTILLPEFNDLPIMRWIADAYLEQLVEYGVKAYYRPGPFVHTKLAIVDDRWVWLGSANVDPRSFRLNFEFNVEVYDAALASHLAHWVDSLLPKSHEAQVAFNRKPSFRRLRNGILKMFSPYL